MDRIGSSIPFGAAHAARAYGITPKPDAARTTTATATATATEPIARIGTPDRRSAPASDPSRLVAARVGTIDPARDIASIGGRASPPGGYAIYRHPADLNTAATGVAVGRSIDVKG